MKRSIVIAVASAGIAAVLLTRCSCSGEKNVQANEESVSEEEKVSSSPLINPFSSKFDVSFSEYTIVAGKDTTLIFQSGTKIFIPSCALTHKDETPVSGVVKLFYREISNQAGIIASGIPMKVKQGSSDFLETTGMMEMKAEQNGKELSIQNGCPVKLEMINTEEGKDVNLYYLDEKTGSWKTVQNDLRAKINQFTVSRKGKVKVATPDYDKMAKEAAYLVPVKPKVANPSRFGFHFKIDLTKYPEVNFYDGIIWEYAGKGGSDDPKNNPWVETARWKEMVLDKTSTEGVYKIRLISSAKTFETKVRPVFDKEDMEYARDVFDYRYTMYKKFVDKKKAEHKKWVQEQERKARVVETMNQITRSFEIDKFGIWNCDRFYSVPNPEVLVLKFQPLEGSTIEKLYLVDQAKTSVIYYFPDSNSVKDFKYEKDSRYKLLALDSEGKVYKLLMDDCIRKSKEGKAIELKTEGKIVSSMKELNEMI